jgi:hypothetical protein
MRRRQAGTDSEPESEADDGRKQVATRRPRAHLSDSESHRHALGSEFTPSSHFESELAVHDHDITRSMMPPVQGDDTCHLWLVANPSDPSCVSRFDPSPHSEPGVNGLTCQSYETVLKLVDVLTCALRQAPPPCLRV